MLTGREVSMATPWAGTTPASSYQLAPSHWTRSVEKYSPDAPYLPKRFETTEGEGGVGTQITASLQIDLRRSAWIHKDLLKQLLNDPLWSGRIRKDSQQVQQLICKGSYKPLLVMCNDQQNQMFCKHTSHTSSYIYNFFFLLEIINYLLHCSLSSTVPLLWVYFQILVILIVNENSLDQTSL